MEEKKTLNNSEINDYIKAMAPVYEPFFEAGCESTDPKTGKKIIMQEDGTWKEVEKKK